MNPGQGKSNVGSPSQALIILPVVVGSGTALALGALWPLLIGLAIAVMAGGSGRQRIDPPPEGPLCDFCYQRPVEWAYPCRDFSVELPDTVIAKIEGDLGFRMPDAMRGVNSMGAWAADQPCYNLIERNDWAGMFDRYWSYSPSGAVLRQIGFRSVHARAWTDVLWAGFRANRIGPAVRQGPYG